LSSDADHDAACWRRWWNNDNGQWGHDHDHGHWSDDHDNRGNDHDDAVWSGKVVRQQGAQ
jgi:hypothetical protein